NIAYAPSATCSLSLPDALPISGVLQDVADLGPRQVVVDRHEVPPGLQARQVQLDHLGRVRKERGDGVSGGESQLPEPVHDSVGRSEEHTSELQSREDLVCRLLL